MNDVTFSYWFVMVSADNNNRRYKEKALYIFIPSAAISLPCPLALYVCERNI